MTPRAARLCMVAATLLWGATFVVIRDTLAHLDPLPLVFTRFVLAACLFAPWTARSLGARGATVWAGGVLSGLLCAGGYAFQSIGLTRTSAGSSAFLTSIGTLFAGLYGFRLVFSWVVTHGLGLPVPWLWAAMIGDYAVRSILKSWRYRSRAWQRVRV